MAWTAPIPIPVPIRISDRRAHTQTTHRQDETKEDYSVTNTTNTITAKEKMPPLQGSTAPGSMLAGGDNRLNGTRQTERMGKGAERIVEIKRIARGIDAWLQTLSRRLIPPRLTGVPERLVLNPTVFTSATDGDSSWSLLEVLEGTRALLFPPVAVLLHCWHSALAW